MKLTVVSTFVKHNRGKYAKFLWQLVPLLYDNGFYVKTVELILESVYEVGSDNKKAIQKEVLLYQRRGSSYPLDYDMDVFDELIPRDKDYIDWREESLRQLVYDDVEFNVKFNTLGELQKYFNSISDSVGYIKKGHVEQFEELKNKLTINQPLKNPF